MISICSLAPALADRVSAIRDELKICTDDKQRQSLSVELEVKRDLLSRMIEEARPMRRKRANSAGRGDNNRELPSQASLTK